MRLEQERNYREPKVGSWWLAVGWVWLSAPESRMPVITLQFAIGEIPQPPAHQRMEDRLKVASHGGRNKLRPSREDNLRQPGTVNAAIGSENRLAEARDYGRDGRAAWRFQLVNDIVRV